MKKFEVKYVFIAIFTFIVVTGISIVGKGISLYNQEINLKNQIEAKQKENTSSFDNMWKKINQTVQVSDKYKDGLKEVLASYTSGRKKESDQLLMDWTKEAIPTFDSTIYKQLMNIITASRDDFNLNQKELIDLNRQHDVLLDTFPNSIYYRIMGIQKIEIKVVTSTKTEKAFESGKDDDVAL